MGKQMEVLSFPLCSLFCTLICSGKHSFVWKWNLAKDPVILCLVLLGTVVRNVQQLGACLLRFLEAPETAEWSLLPQNSFAHENKY